MRGGVGKERAQKNPGLPRSRKKFPQWRRFDKNWPKVRSQTGKNDPKRKKKARKKNLVIVKTHDLK